MNFHKLPWHFLLYQKNFLEGKEKTKWITKSWVFHQTESCWAMSTREYHKVLTLSENHPPQFEYLSRIDCHSPTEPPCFKSIVFCPENALLDACLTYMIFKGCRCSFQHRKLINSGVIDYYSGILSIFQLHDDYIVSIIQSQPVSVQRQIPILKQGTRTQVTLSPIACNVQKFIDAGILPNSGSNCATSHIPNLVLHHDDPWSHFSKEVLRRPNQQAIIPLLQFQWGVDPIIHWNQLPVDHMKIRPVICNLQ